MSPGEPAPGDPDGAGAVPADLGAVGELCRLVLVAQQLGCRVVLVDVEPPLRDLVELAGLGDVVLGAADEGGT